MIRTWRALLPDRFDRCRTPLLGRCPVAREILRARNAGKFSVVAVPAAKLFHAIFDSVGVNGIGCVGRYFAFAPAAGFILLPADQLAAIFMDVFPAKDFFSRDGG